MVGVTGLEPATSCSQSTRATNCATPRLKEMGLYEKGSLLSTPLKVRIAVTYEKIENFKKDAEIAEKQR